jgi:hypothetical protein
MRERERETQTQRESFKAEKYISVEEPYISESSMLSKLRIIACSEENAIITF